MSARRSLRRGGKRGAPIVFLSTFVGVVLAIAPRVAPAEPSVWARAREPELAQRAAALQEAEVLVHKYHHLQRQQAGEAFRDMALLFLREARRVLEDAGAKTSRDPMMRYRLAEIDNDLGDYAEAARHYEYALASPTLLEPLRASGLTELAICYARQGRHHDEINVYSEALKIEAISPLRAMILANRAEAYMVTGDITKAIEGYRASLASLLTIEIPGFGVTTLWGLGVALDRSGDLESGLGSITLARAYDPSDRLITGPGWFYVPEHDDAWYAALGHWARARQAALSMARADAYEKAIASWASYIERAPDADRWLALAKARRRACEAERDAALRRAPRKTP